jgi:hypothetical protein
MLYLQNQAPSAQNTRMAEGEAESAIHALEAAVAIDPNHAESHALIGTLLGMKIDDSALRAIRYGPALSRHRDLAIKHGSSNPRVRYLPVPACSTPRTGRTTTARHSTNCAPPRNSSPRRPHRHPPPPPRAGGPAVARPSSAARCRNSAAAMKQWPPTARHSRSTPPTTSPKPL